MSKTNHRYISSDFLFLIFFVSGWGWGGKITKIIKISMKTIIPILPQLFLSLDFNTFICSVIETSIL